jgi:hypothetical protein
MILRTCLRHVHPDIVLVEGVFIRIETPQLPTAFLHTTVLVHRCILLVAKYHSIARQTFSRAFSTLPTCGLRFIAFELSLATSLTVEKGGVSGRLGGEH